MKIALAATMGVLAALTLTSTASARTMTVTYQGVVTADDMSGKDMDVAHLFGGGDLANKDITAVISYNVALGAEITGGGADQLNGGADYFDPFTMTGPVSPITSAAFTINGDTYAFYPDAQAVVLTQATVAGVEGFVQDTAVSAPNGIPGDNAYVNLSTYIAPGSLQTFFRSPGSGIGALTTATQPNTFSDVITFDTSSVVVSASPEPATWVLLLVGTGLVGGGLRYGRSGLRAEPAAD